MISMRKDQLPKVASEPGAWREKMRDALFDGISEADMTAIMKKQVEKAKAGDAAAAKFVVELVAAKPPAPSKQTLIINEAPRAEPQEPTRARAGSVDKIKALAARAARGESLHHAADGADD